MENAKSASDAFSVGAGAGAPTTPIDTRSNFDALALFQPEVTTDADAVFADFDRMLASVRFR